MGRSSFRSDKLRTGIIEILFRVSMNNSLSQDNAVIGFVKHLLSFNRSASLSYCGNKSQ